jgi:hypothetical protein
VDNTSDASKNIGGTAANLSGTPALPNGTTATTQSQADNSTKLATTAYADGLTNKVKNDGTVNPTNLLSNGDFEHWSAGTSSAPDGWTLSNGSVAREASIVKMGTYSAKVTRNGIDLVLSQAPLHTDRGIDYWKGRTVTVGMWVYATVADRVYAQIYDGVNVNLSSAHPGDSTWKWLTVTATIASNATLLGAYARVQTGDTSVYIDGAMCVEGESSFAFANKPAGEGVLADYFASSTINGWAAGKTGFINCKKIGTTVFVNFYITGTSDSTSVTFTVPYTLASTATANPIMAIDNGSAVANPLAYATSTDGTTITCYTTLGGGGWTSSGTKTVRGQFFYETS